MKTCYVCEKCGKSYEEWDDAYKCENSHASVFHYGDCDSLMDELATYATGVLFPDSIVVQLVHDGENGERISDFVRYSKPVKLTSKEAKPMYDKLEEVKAEQERFMREWE